MLRIRTILHPTDPSEASDEALQAACLLARDHGAKLVLVSVPAPPLPAVETFVPASEYLRVAEQAGQHLESVASRIPDVPVETRVLSGVPGPAIVAAAESCQADLIVMGTHGRKGVSRMLLGSVAEHVVRHAACPVLTVKPGGSQHLADEPAAAAPCAVP